MENATAVMGAYAGNTALNIGLWGVLAILLVLILMRRKSRKAKS